MSPVSGTYGAPFQRRKSQSRFLLQVAQFGKPPARRAAGLSERILQSASARSAGSYAQLINTPAIFPGSNLPLSFGPKEI